MRLSFFSVSFCGSWEGGRQNSIGNAGQSGDAGKPGIIHDVRFNNLMDSCHLFL